MAAFSTLADRFIDEFLHLDPLASTAVGRHDVDGRWPDWSAAGRAERLAWVDRWSKTLRGLDHAALTPDERIDRERLLLELDHERFNETDHREDAWNPLGWVYRIGEGIYLLLAGTFAPPAERLASIQARIEGLPAVIDAAIERLGGEPERPVSRFHCEIALRDVRGVESLFLESLELAASVDAESTASSISPALERAVAAGRDAIARFEGHVREVVLPDAEGEGRLGRERFDARLRFTFSDPAMTSDRILEEAERQYAVVRGEIIRQARDLWPLWCGVDPPPDDDGTAVRAVFAAIAEDHPAAADMLDFCRAEVKEIEAFCVAKDLVGITDEPLEISWTPVFLRSFAGAMLRSPGPFDRGEKAVYSITPPADDWPPERIESFLRENNSRLLRVITIHEAVPGHYLQGVYGNRADSVVRTVFGDGPFAEGWAVYVTQVMLDAGYRAEDPAFALTHWKYYLRALVNAILDVRIHTRGMTEEEAIELMVEGGFQEESEARSKYDRARLSSTQLSTYFVGGLEMAEIELEARRRAALAVGGETAAAAIAAAEILGGYRETLGFTYRPFLERVLLQGKLPFVLLRRALFGD